MKSGKLGVNRIKWMDDCWADELTWGAEVVVCKPRERLAEENDRAGRAGREWAQGLIDDGTPAHRAIENCANEMDAPSGNTNRLAGGIDTKHVIGVAGRGSLHEEISRPVARQRSAVRCGNQCKTSQPNERPSLPRDRSIP